MSKLNAKRNSLPPLQKDIILCLAEKGLQTINETTRNLKGHYKSVWMSFHSLEKKGLIEKISAKTYRGLEYPQFWLTERGIVLALVNKTNPNLIQKNIHTVYENQDIIDFLCELARASPQEELYEIYTALKVIKKTNNRILGQAIYRIVMSNDVLRKMFEEFLAFRKKVLEVD